MKIIKPITLTDSILTSTNVHEVAPAIYNAGTTYAAGAFCHVVNRLKLDIYESLVSSNTGNAPASSPTKWIYRSYTYPAYAAGTTYGEGDIVIVAASHKRYESVQAANTGNAVTDVTWWLDIGSTEPWKAYDKKIGGQVIRTGSITYTLTPGVLFTGISFFNLDANNIVITVTDPTDGVVYTKTISLIETSNVFDWYTYFFSDIYTVSNAVETDLPPYPAGVLSITINGFTDTSTVKVGEIVFGQISDLGPTQYSPSIEIIDYSTKEADVFGEFEIVERDYSKKIPLDILIPHSMVGFVLRTFEIYRATAVVYIVTEVGSLKSPYLIYGFYSRFQTVAQYVSHSLVTVEITGLT